MKTFLPLIVLIFCVHEGLHAQLQMDEFFASSVNDPEVKTFSDQVEYLAAKPYRLSPVQRVEFRSRNREMLATNQDYAFRINPANPWEVRSNNRYFSAYQSSLGYELEIALRRVLSERYNSAIRIMYLQARSEIAAASRLKIEQELTILDKQAGSRFFDADDMVEAHIDQAGKVAEMEEISYELATETNNIFRVYPEGYGKEVVWTFNDVIPVAGVKRVVDSLSAGSSRALMFAWQQSKVLLAQREYALEKSNINVGFFQSSYDRRRFNQNRNPFTLSFGITIPVTNPNKGDMAKRKLDIIEAEYDLKESVSENELDRIILQDRINGLLRRYENLRLRIDEMRQSDFARTLSMIKGGDPLMLVRFDEQVLRLELLLLKIRRDLYLAYVEYLAFSDNIQKRPLVNFLSPALKTAEK